MVRVLVVDDDEEVRNFLEDYLTEHGDQVLLAADGAAALAFIDRGEPIDIVLLDLVMPRDNGIDVARRIRTICDVPIIMLTGRGDTVDCIVGLELGADDFVSKPFNARELRARIGAVLRRTARTALAKDSEPPAITFEGWRFDPESRALTSPTGGEVALTGAQFALLTVFLKAPQRVLSREHLLDALSNDESFDRSIDVQVLRLRRKIEADPRQPTLIKSVRGAGYMFTGKVAWPER